MPSKEEIEKRKLLKKQLRENARKEFEENLPISRHYFKTIFDYLNDYLEQNECDHTLNTTLEILRNQNITNVQETISWLNKNGGYCDCEVLYNVEELFDEDAIL
ncbi:Protein of unknown function [Paenimyroides ummariense]|uniref:DUF2695 domain-containing protein n=1 Tax=Paenimyroides ummariense TaxID=913024 RepID=A0A1I4Y443_9FLAO|nr:DUF2695 domain-containing protein [Paenimyroides ummariense]SFN32852.1 Protein of unknown function [Paenimyroides ummariense]